MAMTLEKAREILDKVETAYTQALEAQQWSASGRQVSRATLFRLAKEYDKWRAYVAKLERGGMVVRYARPVDDRG